MRVHFAGNTTVGLGSGQLLLAPKARMVAAGGREATSSHDSVASSSQPEPGLAAASRLQTAAPGSSVPVGLVGRGGYTRASGQMAEVELRAA